MRRIRGGQPVEQHANGDVIGDELAAVHVCLGFKADPRARGGSGSEHVAGRQVKKVQARSQHGRLRSFSSAGRAEQNDHAHSAGHTING